MDRIHNIQSKMTGILMAMVAKSKNNKKCFYTSVMDDDCDILNTIYELHYTILPICSIMEYRPPFSMGSIFYFTPATDSGGYVSFIRLIFTY